MARRYVSIWFKNLAVDWLIKKQPDLKEIPFVITFVERGKVRILTVSPNALRYGVKPGHTLADACALCPSLKDFEDNPERNAALLEIIAGWCIRYTPFVSLDAPDGLFLDVTGCTHLLGGETPFLKSVITSLMKFGYQVRAAMADTPGAAWAVARFAIKGANVPVVPKGMQKEVLSVLPPAALRLSHDTAQVLSRSLGIRKIRDLLIINRASLSRRFGKELLMRLDQAFGDATEALRPVAIPPIYSARLDFMDTISTAEAISWAVKNLLDDLCSQLERDQRGLRQVCLSSFRVDGFVQHLYVGTSAASRNPTHIFRLYRDKLTTIAPGLGIDLFILSASQTDSLTPSQDKMMRTGNDICNHEMISELVDRFATRLGSNSIYCLNYVDSHLPERAFEKVPLDEKLPTTWNAEQDRPVQILQQPEPIEVMTLIPDYPPKAFTYRGKYHRIRKADGPERLEAEWWLKKGDVRDYYKLEDEQGRRYWVYRNGRYNSQDRLGWFMLGFFG